MSSLLFRVSEAFQRRVVRAIRLSLDFPCQFEGTRNVAILSPFVAATEEDDDGFTAPDEIHPVTGTVVDPHLRDASANRPDVSGIAKREAADANRYAGARIAVSQPRKPFGKNRRSAGPLSFRLSLIKDRLSIVACRPIDSFFCDV